MSIYNVRVLRLRSAPFSKFELSVFPIGYDGTLPTRQIEGDQPLKEILKTLGMGAEKIIGLFFDVAEEARPVTMRVDITDTMAHHCGWTPLELMRRE